MAGIVNRPNGHRWVQWYSDGAKFRLRLGKVSQSQAETVKRLVEAILGSTKVGERPAGDVMSRVRKLDPSIQRQLDRLGLIGEYRNPTLQEFVDDFVSTSIGADNTVRNHEQLAKRLVEFFGANTRVKDIKPSDADRWRKSRAQKAPSTINREIKRCKQFFAAAVRDEIIQQNPFSHLKAGKMSNPARSQFVPREIIDRLMAACHCQQWRIIIALSRYGGLRVPSEILECRWEDVDWDRGRMSFYSPKDKRTRTIPLFPELREELEPERQESGPIVTQVRVTKNLRLGLLRILKRANVKPWPRIWHNLRASRTTELCDKFPAHVVTQWVGNSERVAKEHYLLTHDGHFEAAIKSDQIDTHAEPR